MPSLNKLGMHAPVVLTFSFGANAQAVDTALFVADDAYELVESRVCFITAGTDGGGLTLDLAKAASGTAIGSATSMLATTFNLQATAATPITRTVANGGVHQTLGTRQMAANDTLYANFTGVTTALVGLSLQVVLKRLTFTTER